MLHFLLLDGQKPPPGSRVDGKGVLHYLLPQPSDADVRESEETCIYDRSLVA